MKARVLIADDSAFVRKVLREILERAGFDVVDVARDGLEALEKIERLAPDVVTLDLTMPHLDGLGVLASLREQRHPARVVVVSISGADTGPGIDALERGAVALVEKPTALATAQLLQVSDAFVAAVEAAAAARPPMPEPAPTAVKAPLTSGRFDLVVMGASTGGPQALTRILRSFPADFPVPIAGVLHIPPGYTEPFTRRVDSQSALRVVEASEGLVIQPGMAVIARAGLHLALSRSPAGAIAHLEVEPLTTPHRPAVDVLFRSAAEQYGGRVLAVVLTGMGDDGTAGARAIRQRGGHVLVESEASCVVYGMPRSVREAGLADEESTLDGFAERIASLV